MSITKCQAFKSCLSLSWGSSILITECPAWDTNTLKRKHTKYRKHFVWEDKGGLFPASFPIFASFWVKTAQGTCHVAHCLWIEIPPNLFPFSLLALHLGRQVGHPFLPDLPANVSEHNLPPDSFNEYTSDWCCLLGSQCDWPSTAEYIRSCGFLV